MDLKLKNKRAIVLGGTRGIGRSIAETLADEGCHVAICARKPEQIKAVVADLASKGVMATGAPVDIADGAALTDWVKHAAEELGGLDILIANASASMDPETFVDADGNLDMSIGVSDKVWQKCLAVDVLGCKRAAEAAYPMLEAAGRAHGDAALVALSSYAAWDARYANAYGALKGALIHLIKGLASQWAASGVRANAVSPGTVYFKGGILNWIEENHPELYREAISLNPTGRMATPQEVADAVVFLASPLSSFTTGANLVVDGAITGRVNY